MIKKVKGGYALFSKDGKRRLSRVYKKKDSPALQRRIRQVEYYKRK